MGARHSSDSFNRPIHQAAFPLDVQLKALGPRAEGREGIFALIDGVCGVRGISAGEVRVLEMGSGSGRLADGLLRKAGIRPENYVMGDVAYGTAKAPAIKRGVFSRVRRLNLDIFRDPGDIGRFDVIAVLFVLGTPPYLSALLDNYFGKLNPGGVMSVTSAHYTCASVNRLIEKVAGSPIFTEPELTLEDREALSFVNRLSVLRDRKLIGEYTNPTQFFMRNAANSHSLTFVIQRNPD